MFSLFGLRQILRTGFLVFVGVLYLLWQNGGLEPLLQKAGIHIPAPTYSKADPQVQQRAKKPIKQASIVLQQRLITPIDGDSFKYDKGEIRLFGIDAPEGKQFCKDRDGEDYACGTRAANALRDLLFSGVIDCKRVDTDKYNRMIAICFSGSVEINKKQVEQGWALAYRRFGTDYAEAEDNARRLGRGIWEGKFQNPEQWRMENRN